MIRSKDISKVALVPTLVLLAWCLTAGCTEERPSYTALFESRAEYHTEGADRAEEREAELVSDIRAAEESIQLAVSTLADEEVAQALIDAKQRGVQVNVVSDWDARESAGLVLLEENGIFPVYGNGELRYLPEPTLSSVLGFCRDQPQLQRIECFRGQDGNQGTMVRPGHFNLMSHNFAVIDERTVWNFPAIDGTNRDWIGWRIESSTLAYDFLPEFKQMHSGVFATTLDIYNGPVKSNTNYNERYLTDQGVMKLWFNPQERLMKLVIDRVYKAKASVWIASDNVTNPFLLDALEYKANNGFDVRVVVHPDHQSQGDAKARLEALGVKYASGSLDHLSTLLVMDAERDRNGDKWGREVLGLSHPLIRGGPFEVTRGTRSDVIYVYPADLFADGNLWMLEEAGANIHKTELVDSFEDYAIELWEVSK
jgi:hypothetical protein